MRCRKAPEAIGELARLISLAGPFAAWLCHLRGRSVEVWFGLRCLDWELGVRVMVAALSGNFLLLLLRLLGRKVEKVEARCVGHPKGFKQEKEKKKSKKG